MLIEEGLEHLDETSCRALLASGRVGRIAISLGALPAVLPVNYGVVDGGIVFLTGEGTKLRAALRNAVVAFEVDDIDPVAQTGWSVLAVGQAREIDDPVEVARALAEGIRPWASGRRQHLVRIDPELLSGRRICAESRCASLA